MLARASVAFGFALITAACASPPKRAMPERVTLAFRATPGTSTESVNRSVARTRQIAAGQTLRDRTETLDFTARTDVVSVDAAGVFSSTVTTVARDGVGSLADLAFPEPNDSIAYVTRSDGTVLRAGPHSPDSLYFIPALPLPKTVVAVGDTWAMDHEWRSGTDKIPLRLEITGILKDIVPCEGQRVCADLEISGRVQVMVRPNRAYARFGSRVRGRALFSIDRGDVLWTEMRSLEELTVGDEVTRIDSCMVSRLKTAGTAPKPVCEPGDQIKIEVPRI